MLTKKQRNIIRRSSILMKIPNCPAREKMVLNCAGKEIQGCRCTVYSLRIKKNAKCHERRMRNRVQRPYIAVSHAHEAP